MAVAGRPRDSVPYILAHSDREIRRLRHQADIINPITRRILLLAGISPGMRVLDVGCGAGDVSLVIAELVGGSGEVVGVDRAEAALAAAERRVANYPVSNISFRQGDPATLSFDEQFDAAVGRYVLMFQKDPESLVRGVARHVKPGGIIAFHEPDWDGVRSNPACPAYDQCCRWIVETFRRTGIETNMGAKLDAVYRQAGLVPPTMLLESVMGGVKGGSDWARQTFELLVTMAPEVKGRGVATDAELDLETLGDRMEQEVAAGGVIVGRSEVGAWTHTGTHWGAYAALAD